MSAKRFRHIVLQNVFRFFVGVVVGGVVAFVAVEMLVPSNTDAVNAIPVEEGGSDASKRTGRE